ncbi:MAG: hypothetical protein RL654_1374 [Pseudomonadota bacterium]|jgi:LacI family transcriptional regulator
MTRKATAEDVALAAGVSRWSVTRALTPGAIISEKTRAAVIAAAEQLGYRPNLLARSLNTKTTHQVAVLVDDFANPHKLVALERLTAALQAEDRVALLIHIGRHFDHAHALLHAGQRMVDAVVLLGTDFRDETLQAAHEAGSPPLFVLARESAVAGIASVSCDAEASMREIVAHLVERGYRRPGFMSGPVALSTGLGRQRHHAAFWARHGVTAVPELAAGAYDRHAAAAAMRRYLAEVPAPERIDVLVCENDVLALGAADVARHEAGLRVPQDLALVGYDGSDLAGLAGFALTTFEQPMEAMAQTLVAMLLGRQAPEPVALPGRLIVRGST